MPASLPVWWDDAIEARSLRTGAAKLTPCAPADHAWKRFNAYGQLFYILCATCGRTPIEELDRVIAKAAKA